MEQIAVFSYGGTIPRLFVQKTKSRVVVRGEDRDLLLEALFVEHYDSFVRLAALVLGNADDASDAVQEAFIKTYSSWWRIQKKESIPHYLKVAVLNECRTRLRRKIRDESKNTRSFQGKSSFVSPPDVHIDESLRIVDALQLLPLGQREVIVLRYYDDRSEEDIARILTCSVGTVKSQLFKARAHLTKLLGEDGTVDENA